MERYAKPEIESAVLRSRVRIQEAMRDALRVRSAASLAPSLRSGIVASQLRFALGSRR